MSVLDVLFPKFCIGCKKWGRYICNNCRNNIEFIDHVLCPACNVASYPHFVHATCKKNTHLDGVISSMKYNQLAKKIVKSIKYQLVYDIYKELYSLVCISNGVLFEDFFAKHTSCSFQPIPLHHNRFKKRGFNQAHELTTLFSRKFPYPILDQLIRVRDTKPQAQIHHKKQRIENIQGAFKIKEQGVVKGKNIILVDDVYTSGSTCNEAARVLKGYGASSVFVWSLARD